MLSLYIHIPFCVKKCRYCGFYSTPYSPGNADIFLSGLRSETEQHRAAFPGRVFSTIYIGGGTPTSLSPGQIKTLFDILSPAFRWSPDAEVTVEANPNTVSGPLFSLLLERGVTRLSIGVQSFSDDMLRALGRAHDAQEAVDSVQAARLAGFRNIGIDLIYGMPGQSAALWKETVERAIGLAPEHVSAYCLSLDEGSTFQRMAAEGSLRMPDEDEVAGMYEFAVKRLGGAGYLQYELSNFALPGFECRHNSNYWDRGEYLGLGPGAWSFLDGRRRCTIADLPEYVRRLSAGLPIFDQEDLPGAEGAAQERLFLGLRTMRGVDLRRFRQDFGSTAYERLVRNLAVPRTAGLVRISNGRLRLTGPGRVLADEAVRKLCS